jgi:hypothetical protein
MVFSLIPAFILTLTTISSISGQLGGLAIQRYFNDAVPGTENEKVVDDIREIVNFVPPLLLFLTALWIIGIVSLVAFVFNAKKPHRFLRSFYIAVSVVSLGLVFVTVYSPYSCMLGMIYGMIGFAVEDVVLRRYEMLDELSKEPGYPTFLDYFDYANNMKNTIANYADYSNKLKEKHEKDKSLGVEIQKAITKEDFVPETFEPGVMPELSVPVTYDDYSKDRASRSVNNEDNTDILLD